MDRKEFFVKCKICGGELNFSDGYYICDSCHTKCSVEDLYEKVDTFLCYTECDDSGRRTNDSIIANDIYQKLENKDIKTFYSRNIDNLSHEEYEKASINALNKAKTVLVIGTSLDYFEKLTEKYNKYFTGKIVIPVFSNMDAKEIPNTVSSIQAIDYNKVASETDLINSLLNALGREKEINQISITNKNNKKVLFVIIGILVALVIAGCIAIPQLTKNYTNSAIEMTTVDSRKTQYDTAINHIKNNQYASAIEILYQIKDYEDSNKQLQLLYKKYSGYYKNGKDDVTLHFNVTDEGTAIANVTVLIDGKLVQITETSQFNSNKIEYQFNDSENNQGIATLQLQNDGLKLSITTKVKNSELNIDSIAETFLLSQKSDKPFTEELNAATLLGFIKNKTTVSDLTQKGINIEFVSPLYKDTGSSLYKIKNSDVYLAVYDFDISKTDDFYGNEETSVNDPIIFAVQAPSNIISPSKVGDDCKHFEENGILYAPNFIVDQEYHVLDFIENDTKETTIQKNTIVSCVSESTIGTIHFNELKKQCCENLVSKYYIESSSFEGEPVVSACTVAESQNNYLIYCYEWLSDEQYPIKYYSINKSNYKITFITELDYDEQNDDRETIWESYPEYFGEFI